MLQIGPVNQKRATPAPQAAWFPSLGLPRAIPVRLGATLRRLALQSAHSVPPVPTVTLLVRHRTLPVSAAPSVPTLKSRDLLSMAVSSVRQVVRALHPLLHPYQTVSLAPQGITLVVAALLRALNVPLDTTPLLPVP